MNIQHSSKCAFGSVSSARCVVPISRISRQKNWAGAGLEPLLSEILSDPIVHLVMARDGLTPADVWPQLQAAQARLRTRRY